MTAASLTGIHIYWLCMCILVRIGWTGKPATCNWSITTSEAWAENGVRAVNS